VLYQPEIPPNTGNVIRLCANLGARLHLIEPLGFSLDNARLRRAGMDYREMAVVHTWPSLDSLRAAWPGARWLAVSTRGATRYDRIAYRDDDMLLFGPETRGLPQPLLDDLGDAATMRIPMRPHNRSLNLSNAVAVVAFEAWRQRGFR
ncbi:MAG: tRNA (cytidine(34)-2'-O)-methyltransferase, partial [Salinisphaera sp.]|nr:tRNA (cytidine(34)-2'-O)-methyltransferase [Salinisphaera sp.]